MADNKLTFGLTNVHYAIAILNEDGTYSFNEPVRLYGAQEFTNDIVGGSSTIYADDQVLATLNQNAGRTISLKVTEISDEFKTDILGYRKLENGNLVEILNADAVTFALGLEFQGDQKARRTWFYLCTVSPINESTKSKTDSVEANSISLSITARPIEIDANNKTTHVTASLGDANYDTFLAKAPVLPELDGGN